MGAKEYVSLKAKLEKMLKGLKDTNLNYTLGAPSISLFDQVHVRPSPGGVNDPNLGATPLDLLDRMPGTFCDADSGL